MKKLSKQDRAVVRTAPDVERRYRLSRIKPLEEDVEDIKEDVQVDSVLSATSKHPVENGTITKELAKRVVKEENKGLSTNDFTNEYKTKLDGIEKKAQENVIEKIKVNGEEQTITNKTVEIEVSGGSSGEIDVVVDNLDGNAIDKAPSQRAVNEAIASMVDIFYPIGSYYETSNTSFNPNVTWGGTWVLEEDGTVLVSKSNVEDSKFNTDIGTVIGEEKVQLELKNYQYQIWSSNQANPDNDFGMLGNFASGGYGFGTIYTSNKNVPHNNIQPSKIVNRWHRTA